MRPTPDPNVSAWVRGQRTVELFTTSITLAEVRYGIEQLPDGRRKEQLRRTADQVFSAFADQILSFDVAAAAQYAVIVTGDERSGTPIDGFDAQIAAICRTHAASLATRNVRDFQHTGIEVVDPWRAAA